MTQQLAVLRGFHDRAGSLEPSTARHRRTTPCVLAALLYAVLLLPFARRGLASSMLLQMLVQIPLLAAVGWLMRGLVPRDIAETWSWNWNGVTGLVLATLAAAVWMLPRSLDSAAGDPLVDAAKFITVPLLIGLPLSVSWPRMGFVLRGYLLSELIGMCFRLGWLYVVSPDRLCNRYLIDDQQRTGWYLIIAGFAILLWICARVLFGGPRPSRQARTLPEA